jgi:hypothetical protein
LTGPRLYLSSSIVQFLFIYIYAHKYASCSYIVDEYEYASRSYLVDAYEYASRSNVVDAYEYASRSYLVDAYEYASCSYIVDAYEYASCSYLVDAYEYASRLYIVDAYEYPSCLYLVLWGIKRSPQFVRIASNQIVTHHYRSQRRGDSNWYFLVNGTSFVNTSAIFVNVSSFPTQIIPAATASHIM